MNAKFLWHYISVRSLVCIVPVSYTLSVSGHDTVSDDCPSLPHHTHTLKQTAKFLNQISSCESP